MNEAAEPTPLPAPFIVGAGRSGTTLLRLMLDAHPRMSIPAETHFLRHIARVRSEVEGLTDEDAAAHMVSFMTGFPTWPDLAVTSWEFDAALRARERFDLAEAFRTFYRLYASRAGKPLWGDKTPDYGSHIASIAELLPEARFIHLIRDGRDVAVSIRPLWFSPGKDIRTIALDWKTKVLATRAAASQVKHYLEIRYEDLLRTPEKELRKICGFIELEWAPEMLEYWRSAADRLGELQSRDIGGRILPVESRLHAHRRTNGPPDTGRIGTGKKTLSFRERWEFRRAAGDLLRELGY